MAAGFSDYALNSLPKGFSPPHVAIWTQERVTKHLLPQANEPTPGPVDVKPVPASHESFGLCFLPGLHQRVPKVDNYLVFLGISFSLGTIGGPSDRCCYRGSS